MGAQTLGGAPGLCHLDGEGAVAVGHAQQLGQRRQIRHVATSRAPMTSPPTGGSPQTAVGEAKGRYAYTPVPAEAGGAPLTVIAVRDSAMEPWLAPGDLADYDGGAEPQPGDPVVVLLQPPDGEGDGGGEEDQGQSTETDATRVLIRFYVPLGPQVGLRPALGLTVVVPWEAPSTPWESCATACRRFHGWTRLNEAEAMAAAMATPAARLWAQEGSTGAVSPSGRCRNGRTSSGAADQGPTSRR